MEEDLLDWELVHGSDTEPADLFYSKDSGSSSVIGDGMILSDHFSVDKITDSFQYGVVDSSRVDYESEIQNQMHNPGEIRVDLSSGHLNVYRSIDGEVRVSDFETFDENTDPSQYSVLDSFRVDYEAELQNQMHNLGDVRVDSSSGHADVYRSNDVCYGEVRATDLEAVNETIDPSQFGVLDSVRVDYELDHWNQKHNPGEIQVNSSSGRMDVYRSDAFGDDEVRMNDFEAVEKKLIESDTVAKLTGGTISHEDASKCLSESDNLKVTIGRSNVESCKSRSNSGGNDLVSGDSSEDEIVSSNEVASTEASRENTLEFVTVNSTVRSNDESKSREIVWWKMPFVVLKYCSFKIGPVWSVSMAAAVMGLVLLRRRFYNMKRKAQRFHLKVTIDDKKASRVMNQAARLNEMFTEVRRVPVIRPAMPSPGAWPVLSLK